MLREVAGCKFHLETYRRIPRFKSLFVSTLFKITFRSINFYIFRLIWGVFFSVLFSLLVNISDMYDRNPELILAAKNAIKSRFLDVNIKCFGWVGWGLGLLVVFSAFCTYASVFCFIWFFCNFFFFLVTVFWVVYSVGCIMSILCHQMENRVSQFSVFFFWKSWNYCKMAQSESKKNA